MISGPRKFHYGQEILYPILFSIHRGKSGKTLIARWATKWHYYHLCSTFFFSPPRKPIEFISSKYFLSHVIKTGKKSESRFSYILTNPNFQKKYFSQIGSKRLNKLKYTISEFVTHPPTPIKTSYTKNC